MADGSISNPGLLAAGVLGPYMIVPTEPVSFTSVNKDTVTTCLLDELEQNNPHVSIQKQDSGNQTTIEFHLSTEEQPHHFESVLAVELEPLEDTLTVSVRDLTDDSSLRDRAMVAIREMVQVKAIPTPEQLLIQVWAIIYREERIASRIIDAKRQFEQHRGTLPSWL